jgi:hypothetical protein
VVGSKLRGHVVDVLMDISKLLPYGDFHVNSQISIESLYSVRHNIR